MLLTNERLRALHNVNRWGGWLLRPYSVLEHTLIGADMLEAKGETSSIRPFLLHDMEESEFLGDVRTHHKAKYLTAKYNYDVERWKQAMCLEAGIYLSELSGGWVKYADHSMLYAEHLTVAAPGDPVLFKGKPLDDDVRRACAAIEVHAYRNLSMAIARFWELFNASGQR